MVLIKLWDSIFLLAWLRSVFIYVRLDANPESLEDINECLENSKF